MENPGRKELLENIFYTERKRTLWLLNFGLYSVIKRLFDLVFAIIGLILLSPLFLIIALKIKKEDGGRVLFKQTRTGQFGETFEILKFRSMVEENDIKDKNVADKHTKTGEFLRKTSLVELPQLINVLKGEMSFIGPRPWITDYYDTMMNSQKVRTLVKPVITGLAQANGRNGITIFEKLGYDLEYVRKFSIFTDIRVIFASIRAVLSKEDADAGKKIIHDEISELKADNKRYMI